MNPVPPELLKRKRQIAEILVSSETNCPNSIRLMPNPGLTSVAVKLLAGIGYKKPFFTSGRQFAIDCFLTYPDACDCLLTFCVLVCSDDQARQHVWDGYGVFKKCLPSLPRFEGHEPIIYAVNIKPIMLVMADILEPSVPDGCSFERPIVLQGAIFGFAAIVENEYLREHYPGYKVNRQSLQTYDGKSFDVVDFITANGESKTVYFALTDF